MPPERMNRRDFLHPQGLALQTGQLLGAFREFDVPAEAPPVANDVSLLRGSRHAMATQFEVLLPFGTPKSQQAFEDVFDHVDRLEQQLTVYSEKSEVSQLNRLAFAGAIQVEERLFRLLYLAKQISIDTEGAFDITSGTLIKTWGFFRGPPRVPSCQEIVDCQKTVGMHHVELDLEANTVRFNRSGIEINLGSIGKGYALDCMARRLRGSHQCSSALLHGGRSSVYAIGTQPGERNGWRVGIQHPWHPEQRLGVVWLRDQALGTSAATFRHLDHKGRKFGHILDPRTGWPAEGIASASVIAPSAAEADALATAFFILGVEKARAYCEKHPQVAAIILPQGADAKTVAIGACLEENSFCAV
jgi:thiamine biosynthesis lipoprotein